MDIEGGTLGKYLVKSGFKLIQRHKCTYVSPR